jgi:hypothetical protein
MDGQRIEQMGQSNEIRCRNIWQNGKPTGGYAHGPGMCIAWQDGPRGTVDGVLQPANGAFVEDALVAAHQRLDFFQRSEFVHPDNAEAMGHIQSAIDALHRRAKARAERGVLGSHAV